MLLGKFLSNLACAILFVISGDDVSLNRYPNFSFFVASDKLILKEPFQQHMHAYFVKKICLYRLLRNNLSDIGILLKRYTF